MEPQRLFVLSVALLGMACGGTAADVKTSRPTEPMDPAPSVLRGPPIVYGLPNLDNLGADWNAEDPDDDEIVRFEVVPSMETPAALELELSGSASTRIWWDGGIVARPNDRTFEMPGTSDPIALGVEFKDFDSDAILTVRELDSEGAVTASVDITLRASPLLLNHHLQPAEFVVATTVSYYGITNDALVEGYEEALGDRFEAANGNRYFQDPWMQDEIEFGYGITPYGDVLDIVVDSIRDRGLDDYPEDVWAGESFGVKTWGRGYASSQDSFGNLEVTPPVEGYPFGRIYYGASGGFLDPQATKLFEMFEENRLQAPFEVDISWLCVGHVDEFMTFIGLCSLPSARPSVGGRCGRRRGPVNAVRALRRLHITPPL